MSARATSSRPPLHTPRAALDAEAELYATVARLSIQDLDELEDRHRTLGTRSTDTELALRLARQELEALQRNNRDHELAQRLAGENGIWGRTRVTTTPRVVAANPIVRPPHVQAPNIHRTPQPANPLAPAQSSGGGWLSKFASWLFTPSPYDKKVLAASKVVTASQSKATPSSSRPSASKLTGHTCVICQDPIRGDEVYVSCGHYYDKGCVLELFEGATRDETLYPPRCCRTNIPTAPVLSFMTPALRQKFEEKGKEFGTLNRVYCSNPRCSVFLGPHTEVTWWAPAPIIDCSAQGCNTSTCSSCKSGIQSKLTHKCEADKKDEDVLRLGEQSQWARCPGCTSLVELTMGCYHMTCRCKTEFCYLCKARWKTCGCTQWDERRLLVAAEARVDAQLGVRPAAPAARDVLLNRPVAPRAAPPPIRAVPVPPLLPRPPVVPAPTIRATVNRLNPPLPQYPALVPTPVVPRAQPAERPTRTPTWLNPWLEDDSDVPEVEDTAPVPTWRRRSTLNTSTATSSTAAPQARPTTITSPRPTSAALSPTGSWRSRQARVPTTPAVPQAKPHKGKGRAPSERDRLVKEAMAELRVNHDCNHERWNYRPGAGQCQHCHHNLPNYLYRCRHCHTLACKRCRHNRL